MNKLYSVTEICKLTSISVRTLHYYDEINLLKPNARSTAKRKRLYSSNELMRLQQIVSLKYLGFSLAQIKKILYNNQENAVHLFKLQAQALHEEKKRLVKICHLLDSILSNLESKESIDWNSITTVTAIMRQKNASHWYENYLNPNEIDLFSQVGKKYTKQWQALIDEVKAHIKSPVKNKSVNNILDKWSKFADEIYKQNPELKYKLWEAYKDGIIADATFDNEVTAYLANALNNVK